VNKAWTTEVEKPSRVTATNKCEHFSGLAMRKGEPHFNMKKTFTVTAKPATVRTIRVRMVEIEGQEFELNEVMDALDSDSGSYLNKVSDWLMAHGFISDTTGGARHPSAKGERLFERLVNLQPHSSW
jgi:hypothetical protein